MRSMPSWLKKRLSFGEGLIETKRILSELGLNTVCEASLCPNLNECYSARTATFLILGKNCTRCCGFCSMGRPETEAIDPAEPEKIAVAARRLGLKYVVVTSVTRDDLADGGSGQFARVVEALKKDFSCMKTEVLVPDFNGDVKSIEDVVRSGPDVFSHNIETVSRLYPIARRGADYNRSLEVLRLAKEISGQQITKSGIMVGLGETEDEVIGAIRDIREAGCDILTVGQYLKPRSGRMAISRFAAPEEFARYKEAGESMGFRHVASGPFVRSSYLAEDIFNQLGGDDTHDRRYAAAVS